MFFEKFAKKYFEEAQRDIERAKRALDHKDFPEAVFHAQQCVEKAVMSMIEVKRKYVYNHGVLLNAFSDAFSDEWREEFDSVLDILGWFTEYYTGAGIPSSWGERLYPPENSSTGSWPRRL